MRKFYGEKRFDIDKNISIECMAQNTSYGFRHVAEMRITTGTGNDYKCDRESAKACYYNRTWESFEYESVLNSVIGTAFESGSITKNQKAMCDRFIKNGARVEDDLKPLKMVSMVAKLGSIFSDSQKGANDWKTRILTAGLSKKGLIMPDDWETLSEDEKTKRLDGAISVLA